MWNYSKDNLGDFVEKDCKKSFTYKLSSNTWGLSHGLKYEIDVLDGTRCANITKTRAYVCIDEDSQGNPVIETWILSKHNQYN